MIRQLAFIVIVAFSITATIVISITLVGYHTDNQLVTAKIQTALTDGAVEMPPVFSRNRQTGIDTWTDCLTLQIATSGHQSLSDALTTSYHFRWAEGTHACDHLSERIGPLPPEQQRDDYWRYWWGSASLLNIALGVGGMSLSSYQSGLTTGCYVSIMLVGTTALIRYRRAALPMLPLSVALLFGFGLPLFGQSVAHAPSFIVGMLLLSLYMIAGIDRLSPRWQFVYLFNVGGMVFYFDLLNGHLAAVMICFALMQVISIRCFGAPKIMWPSQLKLWPTTTAVVSLMMAYFMGAVTAALLRILLRSALLGQNIFSVSAEWLKSLSVRTGNTWTDLTLPNSEPDVLHHLYYNIEVGTFPYIGRHATVLIYAVSALVYLPIFGWLARHWRNLESDRKDTFFSVSLIVMVVPLWYGKFLNHTVVHFWMTGRLLSLFSALALSMIILVLDRRFESMRLK
jgi:hypothetical protein